MHPDYLQAIIDKSGPPMMSWPMSRPEPDMKQAPGEEQKPLVIPYHEIAYDAKAIKLEPSAAPEGSKEGEQSVQ